MRWEKTHARKHTQMSGDRYTSSRHGQQPPTNNVMIRDMRSIEGLNLGNVWNENGDLIQRPIDSDKQLTPVWLVHTPRAPIHPSKMTAYDDWNSLPHMTFNSQRSIWYPDQRPPRSTTGLQEIIPTYQRLEVMTDRGPVVTGVSSDARVA